MSALLTELFCKDQKQKRIPLPNLVEFIFGVNENTNEFLQQQKCDFFKNN